MRGRKVRGEELWAQAIISAHLGRTVECHDDGSKPGMHDYTIILTDGSEGAEEVTLCADSRATKTFRALQGDGKVWDVPATAWWLVGARASSGERPEASGGTTNFPWLP
jgi:hypothetical protein